MAEADELVTWLGFKFKPDAKKNIDDAKKGVETLKNGVKKLNDFFFGAGGAINYFKDKLFAGAQNLENLSKITGMSMTNLQKWKYAAQASGVSFESLVGNLQNFKKVGIDVLSLSSRLAGMSDKIALQYKDEFGISDDMYILLRKGPQEIKKLLDSAPVLSEEELRKTVEANKELAKVTAKIENIKTEIMTKFAPYILKILEGVNEFLDKNGQWLKDTLMPVVSGLMVLFVGGKLMAGAKAIYSVLKGAAGLATALASKRAIAATPAVAGTAAGAGGGIAGGAAGATIGTMAMGAAKGLAGIGAGLYSTSQAGYALNEYMQGNTVQAVEHGLKAGFTTVAGAIGGPFAAAAMAGLLEITEEIAEVAGDAIGNWMSDGSVVSKMTNEERLRYMRERGYINNSNTNSGNTVNIQVSSVEQATQISRDLTGGQMYTPVEPGSFGGNIQT